MKSHDGYLNIDHCIECETKSASPIYCYECYQEIMCKEGKTLQLKCIYCPKTYGWIHCLQNHMKFWCKSNPLAKCNNK